MAPFRLRSRGPRPLWALTVTNSATGAALDKPAISIDGNHHAGEVTSEMVCLYTIWHLLTNYGQDAEITSLLDRYTFYFRPIVSPDRAEMSLPSCCCRSSDSSGCSTRSSTSW